MKRNALKIICNPYNDQISYYFRNEQGIWVVLSGNSPLSRQYYTNAVIKERVKDIVEKIDEIYNKKNKGLDILFEGSSIYFDCFKGAISYYLPDRDITCSMGVTKIAVVGKTNVGKSSLIEGMEEQQGYEYSVNEFPEYYMYSDEENHAEWYEIKGIDFEIGNVQKVYQTLDRLIRNGLSIVIYCVGATTGRLETAERDLINRILENHADVTVLIVLTIGIKKDVREFVDEIEKMTDQIRVVTTLAKEYEFEMEDEYTGETKYVTMKPYGLDTLSKYVFERR